VVNNAKIVVLCGGTGAAKFLQGLAAVVPPRELACIVNTGDDFRCWGLHVSPDLDSITYGLAGLLSRERGWGVEGDTFECLARMRALGEPAWFSLGDRDLATHLHRTQRLTQGATLSEVTAEICDRLGVAPRVLPMSDDRVETRVMTALVELGFQEYFVRERHAVRVSGVRFEGAAEAEPTPGVVAAIAGATAIVIAPSNPITSIGPILALAAIREALRTTSARVVAISPIVGGAAVSGPAAELMRAAELEVSAVGVARAYLDFLDVLVCDEQDAALRPQIEELGLVAHCCPTLMTGDEAKQRLARETLAVLHHEGTKARSGE